MFNIKIRSVKHRTYLTAILACMFKYFIEHCFIGHLSDSTVSEDAGIESSSQIFSPWLEDMVDYGKPVRQPYVIVDYIPQSETKNLATGMLRLWHLAVRRSNYSARFNSKFPQPWSGPSNISNILGSDCTTALVRNIAFSYQIKW